MTGTENCNGLVPSFRGGASTLATQLFFPQHPPKSHEKETDSIWHLKIEEFFDFTYF